MNQSYYAITSNGKTGDYFSNLRARSVVPDGCSDVAVNTDNIVVNTPGYYILNSSCKLDATSTTTSSALVNLEINGSNYDAILSVEKVDAKKFMAKKFFN